MNDQKIREGKTPRTHVAFYSISPLSTVLYLTYFAVVRTIRTLLTSFEPLTFIATMSLYPSEKTGSTSSIESFYSAKSQSVRHSPVASLEETERPSSLGDGHRSVRIECDLYVQGYSTAPLTDVKGFDLTIEGDPTEASLVLAVDPEDGSISPKESSIVVQSETFSFAETFRLEKAFTGSPIESSGCLLGMSSFTAKEEGTDREYQPVAFVWPRGTGNDEGGSTIFTQGEFIK